MAENLNDIACRPGPLQRDDQSAHGRIGGFVASIMARSFATG